MGTWRLNGAALIGHVAGHRVANTRGICMKGYEVTEQPRVLYAMHAAPRWAGNTSRPAQKIKLTWPGLNYTTAPGVLILHPSIPTIAPLNQGQLAS